MIFENLNDRQVAAITHEGNVLLLACPGSGKTRVLSRKVAYELDKISETKKRVAAITFTNIASDEIEERIDNLCIPTTNLWTGTIHSFCLDWIIRPYSGHHETLRNGFKIADPYVVDSIIEEAKAGKNIFIDSSRLKLDTNGNLIETDNAKKAIITKFYEILRMRKFLCFDDILYQAYVLVKKFPYISKSLSNIFHYICIDEYQDTQILQYEILHSIVKAGNTKVFYVGDPNQSVFNSLGGFAMPKEKIKEEINAEIDMFSLNGNYRTNQRIINFYSHFQIIGEPIEAVGKNSADAGIIKYHKDIDKRNLPEFLASLIQTELDNGTYEDEICILAPQWNLLYSLGRQLRVLLPDCSFNAPGLSPLSSRLIDNFWYKVARLFLTEPNPSIYSRRVRWANEVLNELNKHISLAAENNNSKYILRIINSINCEESEGIDFLEIVFKQFNEQLDINIESIEQLKTHWDSFFQRLNERVNHKEDPAPSDTESLRKMFRVKHGITINTCQGVKGEEYDTVIAFGLLHGYIPHWYAPSPDEDAKKLLYVISSRAKQKLHLISEIGRKNKNPTNQLLNVDFQYD